MLNEFELTGRASTHVEQHADLGASVHRGVLEPYLALKAAAAADGIELKILSGFRDIGAQLRIWNAKYRGERPLYDAAGKILEHASLDARQLLDGILCWSALPGASRHHWGTDVDVVDSAAVPENYRVRLVQEEFNAGGIFHRLRIWLGENMARFGFFFPYAEYRGGVYPEPWHLSHVAISTMALQSLTPDLVAEVVRASDLLGKEQVLVQLPEIYRRYVANISALPAVAGQTPTAA